MKRFLTWTVLTTALAFSVPAHAIVIRHDTPDSDYVVDRSQYPCVARISGFAEGTLIGSRWVLTAAHVAVGLNPFNGYAEIAGKKYRVEKVLFHPKADFDQVDELVDMALLYLAEPVLDVQPAELYSKSDEVGKIITFVGAGLTGNGKAEPKIDDQKTRAAKNKVDSVNERQIVFTFDEGKSALPTEGISGPGDSGGPALIKLGNKLFVMGVSNSNSKNPGDGHCMYGTREFYARVSTKREWILSVMNGGDAPSWGWGEITKILSPSPQAQLVGDFFKAYNLMDRSKMEEFDSAWRSTETLGRRTPDQRWAVIESLFAQRGKLTPLQYSVSQQGSISIRVRCEKTNSEIGMGFIFALGDQVKLLGFTIVDIE